MKDANRGRLYLPEEIDKDVKRTVKNHLAETYGGYTVIEGRGGWINESKELIQEDVQVLEVCSDDLTKGNMEGIANWVAKHTNQDCVMWDISQIEMGFES